MGANACSANACSNYTSDLKDDNVLIIDKSFK